MDRREFLKGSAWMMGAAVAAGCMTDSIRIAGGSPMQGFRCQPLRRIRVGVVGCGERSTSAIGGLPQIPGVTIDALCDLHPERTAFYNARLEKAGRLRAHEYVGAEAYKKMCESDIDLVYITTGWQMHVPIALYAMECGKHAAIEVPAATTLDECWALVETAERTQRHCYQLENCCYGEEELLVKNLVALGKLGEITHCECGYIHDLRAACYLDPNVANPTWRHTGYENFWRLKHNIAHKGNQYETHGFGPVCEYLNINRGDRLDYLVSLESQQANFEAYAKATFPADSWKAQTRVAMGDMNTTLVKTVRGRSIMVQHDVSSPRPYSRLNLVSGTLGIVKGYPFQLALSEKPGAPVHKWMSDEETKAVREKYAHPLWKKAGVIAAKVGGHGGMDFLMNLRLCYCLQNGLPLDTDVYDLATWCCLGTLTERSVRNRSASVDVPDFTRGGWKTAAPFPLFDIDLSKMGSLGVDSVKKDDRAFTI